MYISILACTARLLFMFTLYIGRTFYCFPVSNFLRDCLHFNTEFILELCCDYAKLNFSLPSEKGLFGLRISLELE